jgi:O-antigen ligase
MTESRGELDESAALRIALWEDAKTLVAENPVLGSGFDTYEHMHRLNLYVGNIELTDTHNYYLKVLVETGFVGLGLFLLIQMRMCYVGICLHRQATDPFLRSIGLGLACAMVPVVIVNCFGDRWQYLQNVGLLWVVAGCVVRGLMLAQESANKQKASALQETEASATAQPATVLEGSPS